MAARVEARSQVPFALPSAVGPSSSPITPWPAALVAWGRGMLWTLHSHHCVQAIVALTGTLRVRTKRRGEWCSCGAVLIPPDARHEVDARGTRVVIAFLDTESELAVPFLEQGGSELTRVPDDVVEAWRESLGSGDTLDSPRVDQWVRRQLFKGRRPHRTHAGVRRVLQHLRDGNLSRRQTSLAALASVAGLSPSRLMHVFTESTGIPLRPYVLWLRVQCAACALTSGYTVTDAAHLAGFSDAAHLVRSMRRNLGMTPRDLMRNITAKSGMRMFELD